MIEPIIVKQNKRYSAQDPGAISTNLKKNVNSINTNVQTLEK